MKEIHTKAIRKASEIRLKLGYSLYEPVNVYDICSKLEIDVQFVDINMEGLYVNNKDLNNTSPKILISRLRPFPRRVFTCGHELGHHVFGHGLKIDILTEENESSKYKSDDEILVDTFSAHLLMPITCIQSEFIKRKLDFGTATEMDYYIVSSILGVGYQTLIIHCKINRLIDDSKYFELAKHTPAKIFKKYFGNVDEKAYFKIIDFKTNNLPIDLEVSNYLVVPTEFEVDSQYLEKLKSTEIGTLYMAKKSGISSIYSNENSCFVRIQPQNYIGFAEYRHLEN
ncbi:ImmA/IrrE family metallo-endopeptidase [Chryseobacterium sp. MFBS3-17]|uniref:ImmA/IrrE family metallo-endopeptidase n=1 Tax=Chryseobacterium sp. MFBS3-17 TaxID=2886689 RepID=UPI001D0DEBC9|nr:ImmA/IrrE family metallo-endopeptidase [Chryseobacterium sp. MFBS3-17]MCC2590301.1 ImmA/IrrE family metallo-endopeptidase [Chryseobacterium sp. MFBS3-17]